MARSPVPRTFNANVAASSPALGRNASACGEVSMSVTPDRCGREAALSDQGDKSPELIEVTGDAAEAVKNRLKTLPTTVQCNLKAVMAPHSKRAQCGSESAQARAGVGPGSVEFLKGAALPTLSR